MDTARRRPVAAGDLAPDFCLPDVEGDVTCLRDHLAQGAVLVWFYRAHSCLRCREELAELRGEQERLAAAGVRILVVSADRAADAVALRRELGLRFPILADRTGEVAERFGAEAEGGILPAVFLIDDHGRVRWTRIAGTPEDHPRAKAVLPALRTRRLAVPAPSDVIRPVVATLMVLTFTALGVLAAVADRHLLPLDERIRGAIRSVEAEWFDLAMRVTTTLGSRWLIIALTVPMAFLAWRRCRQLAIVLLLALPVALALELVLKAAVDRPRPPFGKGFGASFPSGHVLAAAAFWGLVPPWTYVMTRRLSAWRASVLLSAFALVTVGVSRVYLGAHWPSDVVAGFLGGALFVLGAEWAIRRPWTSLQCEVCDLHASETFDRATSGAG